MILDYLISLLSAYFIVTIAAGIHVVLYKRDSRAALGWLGLIVLFPYAGVLLYLLFGVNRVHRKARRISLEVAPEARRGEPPPPAPTGASISRVGFHISGRKPAEGIAVETYHNGEQAYPPMLESIDKAEREILLSSYIFDNDPTGNRFVERLASARDRGVDVRVLVDDVGIRYSFPTIIRALKKHGLVYRRFMPLRLLPPSFSINLRTHRKLLIADRRIGFAGGMNIGDRQLIQGDSPHRASDLHFRFEGAVVDDFVGLFEEDWEYAGGWRLGVMDVRHQNAGSSRCRLITDGPDENMDSLIMLLTGVISRAEERVWIMTPYFLPEQRLAGSLEAAALSGVDVRVMIPQKNNWPLVQWALQHNMTGMLDAGVSILRRPPPFAHSKCLIIDGDYSLVGSTNLDPRSLRLNFELGVEVFDHGLNRELAGHFEAVHAECIPFTRKTIENRGVLARLRDGTASMFGPYL